MLTHRFNWKRLSMSSAIAYAPDGSGASMYFSMTPGSFNQESLIEFIGELKEIRIIQ